MKGYLLLPALLFVCVYSKAAIITWDGEGGDSQWNTASNWSGNIVPVAGDDVILDNSVVSGSYIVNLPAGAVTVIINSLVITPLGVNAITLLLPMTNTGNPGLNVTGLGDALVLNNGAILRNSSGALAGSGVSITNFFRINNGGHYIHNTTRANAPIVSQLSQVAGTELGNFEFDVPVSGYLISLNGRTYGTLILSAMANGGSVTYTGNGTSVLNINGNLLINNGVTFSTGMSADFIIKGDFNQALSATFNFQNSGSNNFIRLAGHLTSEGLLTKTGTGLPVLELNGTANQNISISGTITNNVELKINNPAGITLQSALTLPYRLNLTNGKITTSLTNLLTLADNAVTAGASSLSFVEGPLRKIGDDNFMFPVGVGSIYAPVSITNVSGGNISDVFTAEYKRTNPQIIWGPAVEPGMDHVSYVEYWTLTRDAGTAVKKVALAVTATSFCKSLATTYVSRWNGSFWTDEGSTNGGITLFPPYETGTITSTADLSAFGDFTLITDQPFAINPLPVDLISFDANRQGGTTILQWELAAACSKNTRFELQQSKDARTFTSLKTIPGNEASPLYHVTVSRLNAGITYFRLKVVEEDGKIIFSRIVTVGDSLQGLILNALYPTTVDNIFTVRLTSSKRQVVNIFVVDMLGRIRIRKTCTPGREIITTEVSAERLTPGVYSIFVEGEGQRTESLKFIKR